MVGEEIPHNGEEIPHLWGRRYPTVGYLRGPYKDDLESVRILGSSE
jgi:hypothetical protein